MILSVIAGACQPGKFQNLESHLNAACNDHRTSCPSGQYISSFGTATTDAKCETIGTCSQGERVLSLALPGTNTACGEFACAFCLSMSVSFEPTANYRICYVPDCWWPFPAASCLSGTYQDSTSHLEQACKPYRSPCLPDEYVSVRGSSTNDMVCQPVARCGAGTYVKTYAQVEQNTDCGTLLWGCPSAAYVQS